MRRRLETGTSEKRAVWGNCVKIYSGAERKENMKLVPSSGSRATNAARGKMRALSCVITEAHSKAHLGKQWDRDCRASVCDNSFFWRGREEWVKSELTWRKILSCFILEPKSFWNYSHTKAHSSSHFFASPKQSHNCPRDLSFSDRHAFPKWVIYLLNEI